METRPVAVVTGASSGIGRASARRLAADGFEVFCAARRTERVEELAQEIDGRAVTCDVTRPSDLAALAEVVGDRLDVLVVNAGGALGMDTVAQANLDEWRAMFETNVIGATATIQALLPALTGAQGVLITIGSTSGLVAYEGAGGYCGAKFAEHAMMASLRLELVDQPVRICEILPGLVQSDEFSLVRFHGDEQRAAKVYEGVDPLQQEDVADCVAFVASRPAHVNIDQLVVRPRAQAAAHKLHRVTG
ncbi:SDR family NAD(P)-dependent oxidoreductase [Leekyejoonella antrihumi]|uniref:SDR family NAD(P)-dependent oxidoreductase n=1 Tax=Leekyejoonella antrihumi TaxID=1660198 RepID=A0A563DX33_9MICO|nr:SDR family NAD(P)-dependent oxidoreductase [Leekyejoonella antrihumi]TWP34689.1 SDR family NAD(P)-dependent oxidoreductase [Leekyejoonella antrihumi]